MLQIAKVLRSNGTDGGLLLSFRDIDPNDLSNKEPVFIEFDGLPVPFFILDLTRKGDDKAIVHLNDVHNLKDSEELVGKAVYSEEFEEESDEDDYSVLEGWTLEGIGTIRTFIDIPANPCLEVETSKGKNIMVPIHEDLIEDIDKKRRILRLSIPEGLLDL